MTKLTWLGVVPAAAAVLFLAARSEAPRTVTAAADPSILAKLERLTSKIDMLEREVHALRSERQALAERLIEAESTEPSGAVADAVEPPAPTAVEEDPAETTDRYVEHADRMLAAEPSDRSWEEANDLSQRIHKFLPSGSQVEALTCGSTLCRVETRHRTLDAYRAFVNRVAALPGSGEAELGPPWSGQATFLQLEGAEDPAGEVHAVAYLARAGADLPAPPR